MSALRELFAKFFVEADTKELEHAHEKVEGFAAKLKEVGEAVATAFAFEKVKEFVESQVEAAAQLKDTATRIGTTTDELQAMQLAAGQAGVSNEGLATALRFLNRNMADASSKGGESAQAFQQLGVSIKDSSGKARPAGDVMQDLADAIASIDDPARQTQVAMKLLGRGGAELIPLLKEGGKAFEEAREQAQALGGGFSNEFVRSAKEADDAMVRLRFGLTSFKSQVANALLPYLAKAVEWLTTVAGKATAWAKATDGLSHAVQFFGAVAGLRALQTVTKLAKAFGLLRGSVLQSVAAMLKFAAPLLIIGLLYLAYDELATLLKGGDSLIGDALGPEKTKFVADLNAAIAKLNEGFKAFGTVIGSDGTAMGTFTTVVVDAAKAVAKLVEGLAWIVDKGSAVSEAIAGVFYGSGAKDKLGDRAGTAYLTPEAKAAYERLQAGGAGTSEQSGGVGIPSVGATDAHLRRQQELFAEIAARAKASREGRQLPPESISALAGGVTQVPLAGPQVPNPYAAALASAGREQVTLQQQNTTNVEVHGVPTDNAHAVGQAVGAGVATAQQRANDRALTNYQRP